MGGSGEGYPKPRRNFWAHTPRNEFLVEESNTKLIDNTILVLNDFSQRSTFVLYVKKTQYF